MGSRLRGNDMGGAPIVQSTFLPLQENMSTNYAQLMATQTLHALRNHPNIFHEFLHDR